MIPLAIISAESIVSTIVSIPLAYISWLSLMIGARTFRDDTSTNPVLARVGGLLMLGVSFSIAYFIFDVSKVGFALFIVIPLFYFAYSIIAKK